MFYNWRVSTAGAECHVEERQAYGGDAVFTDAGISKCFPITLILACRGGVDAGQLSADEGALSLLVVTPGLPSEIRDGVGIDGVRVVLLGLVLGDGKACDGEYAEGEYRVHIVCLKLGDVFGQLVRGVL